MGDSSQAVVSRRQLTIAGIGALVGAGINARLAKAQGASDIVTAGGGLVVDATSVPWDRETDVLVVGCGGAGAAAALHAAENGAEVLVLEKGSMTGGNTARCGQAIAVGGSDEQAAIGIEDSPEAFAEYLKASGQGDPELLGIIGLESLNTYKWLCSIGVEVPPVNDSPGVTFGGNHDFPPEIPRTHWTYGIWPVLDQALADAGIEVLLETPATALITDVHTGEVVGAVAGSDTLIKARKGVVLSAGGFTNNPDLVYDYVTTLPFVSIAGVTDDGDGIALGQSIGAGVAFLDSGNDVPCYPGIKNACPYFVESTSAGDKPAYIGVNKNGKRFVNEYDFQIPINRAIMQQPGGMCYIVVGETGLEYAGIDMELTTKTSDSIEGLAEAIGLDPQVLSQTVEEWNANCAAGTDPLFGRSQVLKPIEGPTYAAAEICPGFANTLSGLKTDKETRVLTALGGRPIARLYAAGNNGSFMGRMYCTCGMAVSGSITTGIIAGNNASRLEPWE